jgi:hypothetical protein
MGKYPIEMWIRWDDGSMTHDKYAIPKPKKTWGEISVTVFNITYKKVGSMCNRLWSKVNG